MNRYTRTIRGITNADSGIGFVISNVDVYDVLIAFGVTCPARQHAIKKLLCAGQRGTKSESDDLKEAKQSIERAIELFQILK